MHSYRLTPSQCKIEVDPLSVIGSKHSHKKDVNEDSFTECPSEGGQEEIVQQGCHKLAGTLYQQMESNYAIIAQYWVNKRINLIILY